MSNSNRRGFVGWKAALAGAWMLALFAGPGQAATADLVVNPDGQSNDSKPSLAVLSDGSIWMAWHAYFKPSRDRIVARKLGPGGLGPVHQLSGRGTACDAPLIVATADTAAWVFWSVRLDGHWQLVGRRLRDGKWQPAVTLSEKKTDALMPAAVRLGDDRLLLAWSAYAEGRFRIYGRILEHGVWKEPLAISSDQHDSYRPAVAAEQDGTAWIFWDSYQAGNYAIFARVLLPVPGPPEQVSPAGANCLMPTALAASQGLAVAWCRSTDVANKEGAVGQIHTLHMALRGPAGWQIVHDLDGESAGAVCVHGLTPKMEPKPAAKLGHMARLRVPMLLEDDQTIWLLWERKTHHSSHPARSLADLAARPCLSGKWAKPVIFRSGLLDYHLAGQPRTKDGRFPYVASQLPRGQRRVYHLLTGDIGKPKPFQQDEWTGWKPVKLPLPDKKPVYKIQSGQKTYRLYWIDLHNHSGLTCDAHGEPDELFHYARDRAQIDAAALTDNDEVFDDPLTEGEYALGAFFARCFNRDGRFVALPGYEWTSHAPNSKEIDRADPRCWDFRWFPGRCHNNHRTVIYPLAGGPLLRHSEIGNNIERMFDTVKRLDGAVFPHHGSWDITGHPVEVGAEVSSAWHICFNAGLIHRALNRGHRLGFAANSDSHRRNPGLAGALTAVYAEELTPQSVLEALHSRRFYATNGSWIVLDSRANGQLMGEEVKAPSGVVEIKLTAIGTRPIASATLVCDGKEVETFRGTGQKEFHAVYRSKPLPEGTHWYYWHMAQEGRSPQFPGNVCVARGHLAWSTPHWVIVP